MATAQQRNSAVAVTDGSGKEHAPFGTTFCSNGGAEGFSSAAAARERAEGVPLVERGGGRQRTSGEELPSDAELDSSVDDAQLEHCVHRDTEYSDSDSDNRSVPH